MKQKFSFVVAIALLVATGCKKDKNEVTKDNLVGTYKIASSTYQIGTAAPVDAYASLPACEKDDQAKLNADLTYNYVDAGTKCNPTGDDNGTWALPSSTQITIDGESFTIKSFDGRNLAITQTETVNGISYTINSTLTKQ